MIAMSDAMRGFLLNPSDRTEYDNKKQADAAPVGGRRAAAPSDQRTRSTRDLARQIGELDEEKLDPIENRVLDSRTRDRESGDQPSISRSICRSATSRWPWSISLARWPPTASTARSPAPGRAPDRTTTLAIWVGGASRPADVRRLRLVGADDTVGGTPARAETATMAEAAGSVLRASRADVARRRSRCRRAPPNRRRRSRRPRRRWRRWRR